MKTIRFRVSKKITNDNTNTNVLICHDLLRHYKRKTTPRCLTKIDLKKAYAMVSWEFIEEVLKGYGFPPSLVQLVMNCVTTTKFTIKLNGVSYEYFKGGRGLRQEDPMSPLLFVLVMEYLTRTLRKMCKVEAFQFHPMCQTTKLTHLIFADDLMVCCKGDIRSINRVMEALRHFSQVAGLEANLQKSNIFLAGMDEPTKENILRSTGFTLGSLPIRYLCLPLSSKRWNKMDCAQLVEKITKRISVGYTRQLSYAGRLQIINAVFFSIYNFWGTVVIIPQSVLKEIDRKCREFLWGTTEERKKVVLVAWDKVCTPKKYGGINIKCCHKWNFAAVGKLVWQLACKKDVLWVKWIHEVYMRGTDDIWQHKALQNSSWYWRKLNELKEGMKQWYKGELMR